jgi:hypothetical protein
MVIAGADDLTEVKRIKASTTPMTYSIHSKLVCLINVSKEDAARLFWLQFMADPS